MRRRQSNLPNLLPRRCEGRRRRRTQIADRGLAAAPPRPPPENGHGNLANYIPELTKADPAHFGVVLTAADGQSYAVGDADALFTIQSISKPLVYGLALEDHGTDEVLRRVGVEPTGEAFNSIVMDELNNRPFNPMVNAGAIATTALIRGNGFEERFQQDPGHVQPLCRASADASTMRCSSPSVRPATVTVPLLISSSIPA